MRPASRVLKIRRTDLAAIARQLRLAWRLYRSALHVMAIVLAGMFALPFFWTLSSSLKDYSEIFVFPPQWLPAVPQWENYAKVFHKVPYARYMRNTLEITLLGMFGQILTASLVGYGFARFRFRGRNTLFMLVLSTMMLPAEVTLIPTFLLFKYLRWIDTYLPLIVPNYFGGGAFFVFLFRQFFLTLPRDMDEAAKMDGASSFRIYWNVILPLSVPVIATAGIFSFVNHWDDFFGPLIYLDTMEKYTLSLGLRYFSYIPEAGGEPKEHLLMAASVIMLTPCIVLFFTMQKYFVRGVVLSGIKG